MKDYVPDPKVRELLWALCTLQEKLGRCSNGRTALYWSLLSILEKHEKK